MKQGELEAPVKQRNIEKALETLLDERSLDGLAEVPNCASRTGRISYEEARGLVGDYAVFRGLELGAAINRLRTLAVQMKE